MIILAVASLTFFAPIYGPFLFAISYREGPFSETYELHMILTKFRKIADNLPLLGETLYRRLIEAAN